MSPRVITEEDRNRMWQEILSLPEGDFPKVWSPFGDVPLVASITHAEIKPEQFRDLVERLGRIEAMLVELLERSGR